MRFGTITLLLAFGSLASLGCGGGGSAGSSGSQFDNGSYDTPPTDYDPADGEDQPPNSGYDAPDTDYDPTPSGDDPGGWGPSDPTLCPKLCEVVTSLACTFGDDVTVPSPAECQAQCAAQAAEIAKEPCLKESLDFLDCLFNDDALTCEFFTRSENGELNDGDLNQLGDDVQRTCAASLSAFSKCGGLEAGGPPDDGGAQCGGSNCDGCMDACSSCRCSQGNTDPTCDALCTN